MVSSSLADNLKDQLISHSESPESKGTLQELRHTLLNKESTSLSQDEKLRIFDELTAFPLGRFLLKNRGLNGYWTSFVILHGPRKSDKTPLEEWVVTRAPVVRATQERFSIFQNEVQKRLKPNMKLASVPCGVMDDFLTLDYKDSPGVQILGIDLDQESLDLAKENAQNQGLLRQCRFVKENAWALQHENEFDLIVSNGLNIYEKDDHKVAELYRNFAKALKPGGMLITSFLTPPPAFSEDSPWQDVDMADLKKQKDILSEVVQVAWQTFRSEPQTIQQLEEAGLHVIDVRYDRQKMFPTIVAEKL